MQNIAIQFQVPQVQGVRHGEKIPLNKYSVIDLHEKALEASKRYLSAESELTALLEAIDSGQGYRDLKFSSLFEYARLGLGLSESVAYNLIAVARKTRDVPALQSKLESREVSLSNARMIAPVLTPQNQEKWLHAASTLSKRELERAIAGENPRLAPVPEQARYVSSERIELKLGVSEELMTQLRRVQDLLSSQQGKAVTLEGALEVLAAEFIRREDPLRKAHRAKNRVEMALNLDLIQADKNQTKVKKSEVNQTRLNKGDENPTKADAKANAKVDAKARQAQDKQVHSVSRRVAMPYSHGLASLGQKPVPGQEAQGIMNEMSTNEMSTHAQGAQFKKRDSISASLQHQVHLRDGHRCTAHLADETRCEQRRWLEIHHVHWLSRGGKTEIKNLTTLCRAHHQLVHHHGTFKN